MFDYGLAEASETCDDDIVKPFGASKLLTQVAAHEGHAGHVVAVKNNAMSTQRSFLQCAHEAQILAVNDDPELEVRRRFQHSRGCFKGLEIVFAQQQNALCALEF